MKASERYFKPVGEAAEEANDFVGGGQDNVGAQVIVEISGGHGLRPRPVGGRIGPGQRAAAQFGEDQRGLRLARDEQVGHIVVVPIVRDEAADAGHRGGHAGGLGDVLEIRAAAAAAEIAQHANVSRAGGDEEQIEFAGEIEVRQDAIDRGRIVQTRKLGDIGHGAVGGELEQAQSLIAQDDDVLVAVVVDVAHQAAGVFRARPAGDGLVARLEPAVRVPEHAKIAVAFADEKVVGAAMIDVEHAEGAVKILGRAAEGVPGCVGEGNLDSAPVRLFESEGNAHLGVNAAFKRCGVGGRVRFAGDELLVPVEGLFGFLRPAKAQQGLAEEKIRRRIFRLETDDLGELVGSVLEMAQLQVGAAKLETDGVDFGVDVFRLLQKPDCLFKPAQAQVRATGDVVRGRGLRVHAQNLLREFLHGR